MDAITPSETNLAAEKVSPDWWTFKGLVSTQYWRKYPGTVKSPMRLLAPQVAALPISSRRDGKRSAFSEEKK